MDALSAFLRARTAIRSAGKCSHNATTIWDSESARKVEQHNNELEQHEAKQEFEHEHQVKEEFKLEE